MSNPTTGTTQWAYDSLGRLTSSGPTASPTGYTYDLAGRPVNTTYPGGGNVTRSYDTAGRWTGLTDWASRVFGFTYDENNNLTKTTYLPGVTGNWTYDNADRTLSVLHKNPAGTSTLAGFTYVRDAAGQLTTTTPTGAFLGGVENYAYTTLNQLAKYGTPALPGTANLTYDTADNPTLLAGVSNRAQGFDTANQLCWQTTAPATGTCAAPPTGAATFGFDTRGNRTSKTVGGVTTTSSFDRANRLLGVSGTGVTYTYRGDGLRITRAGGSNPGGFGWDEANGLPLLLTEPGIKYLYGPGALVLEQDAAGTVSYLHADQLGTIRALTNTAGAVTGTQNFDPYGARLSTSTGTNSRFGYAGEYTDTETGYTYLRARHYDPNTGQFVNRDPAVASTGQPNSYGNDSPLNNVDPFGLAAYHYSFDLGPMGSPEELAAYTRASCSSLFPIAGCVDNFNVGEKMHLHQEAAFGAYTQSFPVEIINETSTSFEFKALNGHPEGNGRTITFSFCEGDNGHTRLNIDTSSNGSILTNWFGIRQADFFVAHRTWSSFASKIRANYDYVMKDGQQPSGVMV